MKERVGERFCTCKQRLLQKGGSYLYLGSFSETFAVTKIVEILNLIES